VGVINDFRDSFSFIDYKVFGELKVFDACWTAGSDRNSAGTITVFLNFNKVGEYKSKQEAYEVVKRLIDEAPCGFFNENKNLLLDDLCS
jgi:hypothetical protein